MSEVTSKIDVAYVAYLARIHLTDAEMVTMSAQLKDILAYVAQLNQVDVSHVQPTAHATPLSNVLRQDAARPSVTTEKMLQNAPDHARDLIIVPKIVE